MDELPTSHPTPQERRAYRDRVAAASANQPRGAVMVLKCRCPTDLVCFDRLWWACDHPDRKPGLHTVVSWNGVECQRCRAVFDAAVKG